MASSRFSGRRYAMRPAQHPSATNTSPVVPSSRIRTTVTYNYSRLGLTPPPPELSP